MNWKNLALNAIPFVSLRKNDMSFLEVLGHSTYHTILLIGIALFSSAYIGNVSARKDFNPIHAFTTLKNIYETIKREEKIYPERYSQIFGQNDYADTNRDNIIDFLERVGAYRRMGYFQDVLPIAGETKFPKPTLSELEKAVESYESEK